MRTRHKSYKDYGFEEGEEKQLKLRCRSQDLEEHDKFLLRQAAEKATPDLSKEVYDSITQNLSYDDLCCRNYVPIGRDDFYGYQRLTLYYYRNFLMLGI